MEQKKNNIQVCNVRWNSAQIASPRESGTTMRSVASDELAYLIFTGIRSWTPSLRNELAKGGRAFSARFAADKIVSAFYKCAFQVGEDGIPLSSHELVEIVARLIETLPTNRKQAIASSYAKESDAARRATALEFAQSLDHLWITRDTPALPFPYPPLTGKPALPVYEKVQTDRRSLKRK